MKITALDLEMNQPSNTIISIGYCIGDSITGEILCSNELFIYTDEVINPRITELTGITQEQVSTNSLMLDRAYHILKQDHIKHGAFINPLTWGGGDSELLRQQLNKDNQRWLFGRRWIDCKTLYISYQLARGRSFKGGLSRSMKSIGVEFDGTPHSAKADAINTFKFYCHLLKEIRK